MHSTIIREVECACARETCSEIKLKIQMGVRILSVLDAKLKKDLLFQSIIEASKDDCV